MEKQHKELSDKEIALELTKLIVIPKDQALLDSTNDKAKIIADAYKTILQELTHSKES